MNQELKKNNINLQSIERAESNLNYISTSDINVNYVLSSMLSFYKNKNIIVNKTKNNLFLKKPGLKNNDKSEKRFKDNLHVFFDFMKKFSNIFYNNYYHLNCLVLEFKNGNMNFKEVYSELISDKYNNLILQISEINPPAFLRPSLKVYLAALEKWKMYYCLYSDYTNNNDVLSIIETDAESTEKKFWIRLCKINNYFKTKMVNFS